MKTYARMQAGAVAELLRTEADPAKLFHPAMRWVEATDPAVAVGWVEVPWGLAAPPLPPAPPEPMPTLAALHAQVAALAAQVAALSQARGAPAQAPQEAR
jgi:hypothetical protein